LPLLAELGLDEMPVQPATSLAPWMNANVP
jgi:hypothetical protein